MNAILWLPRALYKIYCILYFAITFSLAYPFFFILLQKKTWFKYAFVLKSFYSRMLQLFAGIWLSRDFKEKLPEPPYVICPNHSSYIDIVLLYCVFSDYFIFLGKQEIKKVPLFRIFFERGMDLYVDRSSRVGSHRAFKNACDEIDKGHCVAIFPEATIPEHAPALKSFKNGPFKLAIEKQVPIVPVTFTKNWKLLQGSKLLKGKAGPGITKAIVHQHIPTKGLTENDMSALRQQTFDIINEPLQKLYGNKR